MAGRREILIYRRDRHRMRGQKPDPPAFAMKLQMRNTTAVREVADVQRRDFGAPWPMKKKHGQDRPIPFSCEGSNRWSR